MSPPGTRTSPSTARSPRRRKARVDIAATSLWLSWYEILANSSHMDLNSGTCHSFAFNGAHRGSTAISIPKQANCNLPSQLMSYRRNMTKETDTTYHFPPELFALLVDGIPVLNRSKRDVLLFFRGAGVSGAMTEDLAERLKSEPDEINKYEITRTVLERLNAKGENSLRERPEIIKRVVEFSSFDTCWPDDRMAARGYVDSIRDVVNQKDTFTRLAKERDHEREARLKETRQAAKAKQERLARIEAAKLEFYSLFGSEVTPQNRGRILESVLNSVFAAHEILVTEAFHLVGSTGEGIIEQIDGVISLNNHLYLVEMKWYATPVGVPEISEHLVRLMGRSESRGIFISASEYAETAISTTRDFLQQKLLILTNLEEIVMALDQQAELGEFLQMKVDAAITHKNPYFKPYGSH